MIILKNMPMKNYDQVGYNWNIERKKAMMIKEETMKSCRRY